MTDAVDLDGITTHYIHGGVEWISTFDNYFARLSKNAKVFWSDSPDIRCKYTFKGSSLLAEGDMLYLDSGGRWVVAVREQGDLLDKLPITYENGSCDGTLVATLWGKRGVHICCGFNKHTGRDDSRTITFGDKQIAYLAFWTEPFIVPRVPGKPYPTVQTFHVDVYCLFEGVASV